MTQFDTDSAAADAEAAWLRARGWIENNEREYQKIIRLLTDAREASLFDWDAIEDRGREVLWGLGVKHPRLPD